MHCLPGSQSVYVSAALALDLCPLTLSYYRGHKWSVALTFDLYPHHNLCIGHKWLGAQPTPNHTHTHTYIHTHMHIHAHTHTHMHIHAHNLMQKLTL